MLNNENYSQKYKAQKCKMILLMHPINKLHNKIRIASLINTNTLYNNIIISYIVILQCNMQYISHFNYIYKRFIYNYSRFI